MHKVLIIEDDEELCSLVAEAFRLEKFEAYRATSVENAINILSEKKIDLVFADIVLNDKKSTDYIKDMFKLNDNLKIIFTSAHYDLVKKENIAERKRIIAISKPYDIEKVILSAKEMLLK
ncbi:MAG: response regulator [Elusimicrobia bacterium]|nr:response regulator [Elusimicrobiota bacterium]